MENISKSFESLNIVLKTCFLNLYDYCVACQLRGYGVSSFIFI